VTALLSGFVDDAAIFPPATTPLPEALTAHRRHAAAWYGNLLGPLLISDTRAHELVRLLEADPQAAPLPVTVVVSGGAGALDPALTWAATTATVSLGSIEIALRDEDDLARNARRVATMLAGSLPVDVLAFVELPRAVDVSESSWMRAAEMVAESGHRLKFRTGGETADSHPDEPEFAGAIASALDLEVPFKCTAGLHHAIRNTAPGTGFEQHGFLNVVLATRAILDGADTGDVVRVLADRDAVACAAACAAMSADEAARLRRWFISVGSCSIDEPVQDLVELGLLTPAAHRTAGMIDQESQ